MLRLKVIKARLSHDTETFGKMDPYFRILYGNKKFKTKTHDKGGKNPEWNQTLDIPIIKLEDSVTVSCFDEDLTKDDLICEGNLPLNDLITNGKERWIKLDFKNKLAGEVLIQGTM